MHVSDREEAGTHEHIQGAFFGSFNQFLVYVLFALYTLPICIFSLF